MTIIFLLFVFIIVSAKQFTHTQWTSIRSLLNHPGTTPVMRNCIHDKIFHRYYDWAVNQAYQFKKKYKKGTHNIRVDELSLYALKGLWVSIEQYNASYPFYLFANKMVHYSLYEGYSKLHPITLLPEYVRRRGKHGAHVMLKPILLGWDDFQIDNRVSIIDPPFSPFSIIDSFSIDSFDKPDYNLIFKYKYKLHFTNKKIAILMACSEETIRLKINKIKNNLKLSLKP